MQVGRASGCASRQVVAQVAQVGRKSTVQVGSASRLRKSVAQVGKSATQVGYASRLRKSAAQVGCAGRVLRPTMSVVEVDNKIDHPTRPRPLPSRLCFLLKPAFSDMSLSVVSLSPAGSASASASASASVVSEFARAIAIE